jgi:uncharacterized paraquat-inducible protein A
MRNYWTLSSLPELSHLPSKKRRQLIRQVMRVRDWVRSFMRAILFGALFGSAIHTFVVRSMLKSASPTIEVFCFVLPAVFVMLVSYLFDIHFIRNTVRRQVVELLRGERLPVCFGCGYNLSAVTEDRCPECGKGIRVKQNETD